tara:strand:- start:993 stop:2756 length:1764 start_codon:yes stop_codon:yes gene_type:complete
MEPNIRPTNILFLAIYLITSSCAYFNTLYNAQQYFNEAEKIRLAKEGKAIPLSAMEKYGKTIQKCEKSLSEYPDSRWKIDAYLLMGKATYYRNDYDLALTHLKRVIEKGNEHQTQEADYWQALCRWKKGSSQAAVTELTRLLEITKNDNIKARCHLSLSDIALEESNTELALGHLERGAMITKDRAQRGVIYGQLAEMAFQKNNYEIASDAYSQVITNSLAKEKVEHAHLQILKILRLNKKYRSASRKIKSMLTDDKFKNIAGNLELELVKLYKHQGEIEEAVNRLETIVNDRQRTLVSAEAYFLLGQIYTVERWEPKKAREYFEQVAKESAKSIYKPSAARKIIAINTYLLTLESLEYYTNTLAAIDSTFEMAKDQTDTTKIAETLKSPEKSEPELLYQLGDLEAFTFNRLDQGIEFFNRIVTHHPESPFHSKSLFTLSLVYDDIGDSINANKTQEDLLRQYPNSEFASHLQSGIQVAEKPEEILYRNAEKQWDYNPDSARYSLRTIIESFSQSDLSVFAAYSLGFEYDQLAEIDSAMKYYSWIQENHPNSDQALPAKERLTALQLAVHKITPDTTAIEPNNQIEN